jgi:hypothetical protein
LNRAWEVLDVLPASALKCELLIYCYEEVFEDELLKEAKEIIDSWNGKELSRKEQKVIEIYREAEES